MSAFITHTHSHSLLLPALPSTGTLVTTALPQPVPGRSFHPCLEAFPDLLRVPVQSRTAGSAHPPGVAAPRPLRASRRGSRASRREERPGREEPSRYPRPSAGRDAPRGKPPRNVEGGQRPTHPSRRCRPPGRRAGRRLGTDRECVGALLRPPRRPRRSPRYPPKSRAESHMAAGQPGADARAEPRRAVCQPGHSAVPCRAVPCALPAAPPSRTARGSRRSPLKPRRAGGKEGAGLGSSAAGPGRCCRPSPAAPPAGSASRSARGSNSPPCPAARRSARAVAV